MLKNVAKAQGTIEYLVIIAIVIVIGLIVASISINFFSTEQITTSNSDLKGLIGSQGISIVDATADYEGEGYLNLKNNSGETLTLTKIATENGDLNYNNEKWVQGNNILITINNLCPCEEGQTKKTCSFEI